MSMCKTCYAVIDAAHDYLRIGLARILVPKNECLFAGPEGKQLEDVAPHLFESDALGQVPELILAPDKVGECGILLDAPMEFTEVRRHLRHFLLVRRERDGKRVLFRFYDPRILRVFLLVCTRQELAEFFGPVTAFHCQGDEPGMVLTFTLREGHLQIVNRAWQSFLSQHFPARLKGMDEHATFLP